MGEVNFHEDAEAISGQVIVREGVAYAAAPATRTTPLMVAIAAGDYMLATSLLDHRAPVCLR